MTMTVSQIVSHTVGRGGDHRLPPSALPLNANLTRQVRPQMSFPAAGAAGAPITSEADFDLGVMNHSREMYFLPTMDRLAATVAGNAQAPIKVRTEANGQFLEYVLDGKHPEAAISGSLNGKDFQMLPKHNDDGSWDVAADTTGGTVGATITQEPMGTHFSGLIKASNEDEARFCTERITFQAPDDGRIAVVSGNFACARMTEDLTKVDDGVSIEGVMGDYNVSGKLQEGPSGTLVNEIDLGDIHFHQTFTPMSSQPSAALTLGLLFRS